MEYDGWNLVLGQSGVLAVTLSPLPSSPSLGLSLGCEGE